MVVPMAVQLVVPMAVQLVVQWWSRRWTHVEGPEDALSGDLDGRLGGVGADEIGAVGTAGGVGALTVFSNCRLVSLQ